jgi:hypothetical protein
VFVAVSVVSAHIEETHKRWKLEAVPWPEGAKPTAEAAEKATRFVGHPPQTLRWTKSGYRVPASHHDLGPVFEDTSQFGGLMVVVDTETGQQVWRQDWEGHLATPSGFCFAGDRLYVADLEGGSVFEVDMVEVPGRLLRRVTHPALNDTHFVAPTRRGVLIASTGTDMVIELDEAGRSLYEWWAGDYGFTTTIGGAERLPERDAEHRDQYYHTRYQTTHLNAAQYRDAAETRLLVLLWHQGALVEIDTTRPRGQQFPEVVLDGLVHPHTLRPLQDGGWMFANSQGAELVVLDRDLRVARRIPSISDWIQDAMPLDEGRWLVADVNNSRLVIHDDVGTVLQAISYDAGWRVYGLAPVPQAVAGSLVSRERDEAFAL